MMIGEAIVEAERVIERLKEANAEIVLTNTQLSQMLDEKSAEIERLKEVKALYLAQFFRAEAAEQEVERWRLNHDAQQRLAIRMQEERDRAHAAHVLCDRERQEALERVRELEKSLRDVQHHFVDPEQRDRRDRFDAAFRAAKSRVQRVFGGSYSYSTDAAALHEAVAELAAIDAHLAQKGGG